MCKQCVSRSLLGKVLAVPGGEVASPSQTGLLLLYRHGKLKSEAATFEVKR